MLRSIRPASPVTEDGIESSALRFDTGLWAAAVDPILRSLLLRSRERSTGLVNPRQPELRRNAGGGGDTPRPR